MAPASASLNKRLLTEEADCEEKLAKKQKVDTKDSTIKTQPLRHNARPPPRGMPPVWAVLRGDLTETVDYFRQRQGGAQTNDGSFRGSLLANDYGQRPYLDNEVVLTRAGGGMEPFRNGRGNHVMKQMKDQDRKSAVVRAFETNMNDLIACPIILSDDCRHCPSEPPYPYSVMAHFKPVYHWYEKDNGHLVSRFRWEKFDLNEEAWWVPKDFPTRSGPPDYNKKAGRQVCAKCPETYPVIFAEGFVCLNDTCEMFWNLNGKELTNNDKLTYNPEWLAERMEWPTGIRPPFALRPEPLPLKGAQNDPTYATMRAAYKGIVCKLCGCCIARQRMEGWFCPTPGCGYEYRLPPINIDINMIMAPFAGQFNGHAVLNVEFKPPVTRRKPTKEKPNFVGPWRIETYEIVGLPGCLLKQFHSNAPINSRPGGANDILAQMANSELHLERRIMVRSVVDGTRTNHFLGNFGLPYEFSADVPSVAFRDAPGIVMNALHKMIWAGGIASEGAPLEHLNEVLILGYFEDQAIGYHDDGEEALGQTIVTFSLGSDATMTIRMKAKYFYGATGDNCTKYDPDQPIVQGCVAPEYRRHMNQNWSKWTPARQAAEFTRLKKMQKGAKAPVCFKTTLCHGDFIVMQGNELQTYFEHQISNDGSLRYALTARHVRPKTINTAERHKGDYTTKPEDVYHGDMDAFDHSPN
ncbi:MAG: hypothetical protein Q9218_006321 [Villophora microphyllina]